VKRIVCLFPGQGTQYKEVTKKEWFLSKPAQQIFNQAAEILGWDVREYLKTLSPKEISATELAQPIIYTLDIAAYRTIFESFEFQPSVFMGHSLGEFAALTAAGVLSFEETLWLVVERGRLMADYSHKEATGMISVAGSSIQQINHSIELNKEHGIVNIGAYNSADQYVLSGHQNGLDRVCSELSKLGAEIRPLKVGGPFHSELYAQAGEKFRQAVEACCFHKLKAQVVSSVTGSFYQDETDIKNALARQIESPVLWWQAVQKLNHTYPWIGVEAGPKSILKSLLASVNPDVLAIDDLETPVALRNKLQNYKPDILSLCSEAIRMATITPNFKQDENDKVKKLYYHLKALRQAFLLGQEYSEEQVIASLQELLQAKGVSSEEIQNSLLPMIWERLGRSVQTTGVSETTF
jgi:[acyl-carrier-protein] S-malonyltransferase